MSHSTTLEPGFTLPARPRSSPATLAYQLAARMANVMLTAQVQIAYACAVAASRNAARAADCIERAWPDTPLRALVARAYREQASQRAQAARDVLARARRTCGLAYAAI
jgi:FixJ family two-component response regulator